jgi:protein phosphatase 2C family protein 2/3
MGVVKPKATLPFPLEYVGTYSCHGVEPGMRAGETSAKINQDRGCVCYPFGQTEAYKQALFCVYDGHGALGDKVSHFVMNKVQEDLEAHPALVTDPVKALKDVFVTVDQKLKADRTIDAELSGTTAVVCLYRQEHGSNEVTIWSACAGDSRATLCEIKGGEPKFQDLTIDQKPDTPEEMARIKKAGGFVSPPEEEWGGPARVWLDANMTLPGLAMARSIGDHLVSSVGVTAEPEVTMTTHTIGTDPNDGCKFIIMASDGVWEFIESQACYAIHSPCLDCLFRPAPVAPAHSLKSYPPLPSPPLPQDAVKLVNKFLQSPPYDATVAVTKLIETAAAKWRQEEGDYRDDITAIVIRLSGLFDQATPGSS